MAGIENRLPFLERGKHFGSICTADSNPLSFEQLNTTQLHRRCKSAEVYLMHAFMTIHRATFRHVLHCRTPVHIDGSSNVKLLTAAYELGFSPNCPTFTEIWAALHAKSRDPNSRLEIKMHPIAKADLLVWGMGRTMSTLESLF